MRPLVIAMLLVAGSTIHAADDLSFVNEGVVNAPVADVWKAFSTSEGYKALGPALAEVDLRVGGTVRSRYAPTGPSEMARPSKT